MKEKQKIFNWARQEITRRHLTEHGIYYQAILPRTKPPNPSAKAYSKATSVLCQRYRNEYQKLIAQKRKEVDASKCSVVGENSTSS